MFFLNQQQYSAKRYELTLLEQKIQQTQRVEQNTPNPQRNEIDRLTQLEVNDRVRYSTIQLNIHQPATVRERIDIDIAAVAAQHGNSFWQRAWQGLYTGWYFILNLVIFLITIWPIYLIVVLLLLAYRLIKPYYNKFSTIRQHSNNQHNKPEDPKDNTKT
ncbi:DUF4349 domain-containing protein [Acinetobacter larvae]|uniref:DUF4349 domain-containing protein n=1 Tax=Acinetobacter larvae TaxID=1789224 RepID=A0A1B2LZ12_9GAMM|nr:DUF4349 domain-containing protein [Acinetobacter larvae]AOA58139.1 hypothetical protein BFG52_07075 [Acinetobacter larvae]